ncbi:MAG: tyrosine--tRNA ligase [Desulfobacteraceae bacterium]|nr:tyrosine--tRNA ligase [Desulfobacteraceae bacterium]MBC2758075.1 tyrosine--tRNA ligase [Desulfobacteraceae bacterium]
MNVIKVLQERGFIENMTHENELYEYLDNGNASCYIGFDPTAASLHVGSLVPIMSLAHMQRNGHHPIALVGGGTGLIGDPSGKTEMRKLITKEDVEFNKIGIKKQLSNFINFSGDSAELVDNADWLTGLGYIDFLRDIGRFFSVNRMVKAESYKLRLESDEGLSFIEFNYMLLQAYDFMKLAESHGCLLQMGGSDQWGNIVAGVDLVRRKLQKIAFGITFPLITTSTGAKMGKTANGAVWLDPEKTSPYDYYQFWVNTDDNDVARFLALFTFLPTDEVEEAKKLDGADLNSAKSILAYEATKICHGSEEAQKAKLSASANFGVRIIPDSILPSSDVERGKSKNQVIDSDINDTTPQTSFEVSRLESGIPAFKLYHEVGLAQSGSAARRLIQQGGAYLNGIRIESTDYIVGSSDIENEEILLKAGKKKFHKIKIKM